MTLGDIASVKTYIKSKLSYIEEKRGQFIDARKFRQFIGQTNEGKFVFFESPRDDTGGHSIDQALYELNIEEGVYRSLLKELEKY